MSIMKYQGAEARVEVGTETHKDRFAKSYRIPEIDVPLRKRRTKQEAMLLKKLRAKDFPVPRVIEQKETELVLETISGKKLRDVLNAENAQKYGEKLGALIRQMHEMHIVHGDLTTSNMIVDPHGEVYFIDFGLGYISHKIEDYAVDLHVFREALESKHHECWEIVFNSVVKAYDNAEVMKRLEKVESRGRNKGKG